MNRNLKTGALTIAVAMTALTGLTLATQAAQAANITAVIRLKPKVSMKDLAESTRTPVSSKFMSHYSPEEIKSLSAPSEEDYRATVKALREEGFTITKESPTHLWISVNADHSLFEKVFEAKMQFAPNHQYRNAHLTKIPMNLSQIEAVTGLTNTRKSYPKFIRNENDPAHLQLQAQKPQDQNSGVPQAAIKTAYNFDPIYASGTTGKGQHVAIATYDGFNLDDVQQFYKISKLLPGPTVDQVEFNGTPKYSENSAMETQLDAEMSGLIAPGANIHVFASATNDDAGELAMFTAILDDNRAQVVNYSWGGCETQLDPVHKTEMAQVFSRAVAQGVNIMVASGDNGSDSCGDGTIAADWPGASPDVVAVGGTTLTVGPDAQANEVAWSGSGGGISALWDSPKWQSALGAPYVKRAYPDVAFNADPNSGQAIYAHDNGKAAWIIIGGTSMAAPQWSGFLALVGESRNTVKKSPVGFINPILYSLDHDFLGAIMNDVTSGNNGAFSAGKGFDAVTGLGSMNAANLLQALTEN